MEVRIWSYLVAPKTSTAIKNTPVLLSLILLLVLSLLAQSQERWRIQFFYDKQDTSFDVADLQCPSPEACFAAGTVVNEEGRQKGTIALTSDGGAHWSLSETKENPVSLFFLNETTGWMVTDRGVWSRENGGWKKLDGRKGILRVHFLDAMRGLAIGFPDALYQTVDGGRRWTSFTVARNMSLPSQRIVYSAIAFSGKHGIIAGQVVPEPSADFSIFTDPTRALSRRTSGSIAIVLETNDEGLSWNFRTGSITGTIKRVVFTKEGKFLTVVQSADRAAPSSIIEALASPNQSTVYAAPDRVASDIALLPQGGALLAAIEPPGNSPQIPIPGKLRLLRTADLKTWQAMDVDYRAVARQAILSVPDSNHMFVGTDTGMILGLATAQPLK